MNFSNEHIDEQIGKYLSGEATPEEAIWLDEWRLLNAENESHFKQLENVYNAVNGLNEPKQFNADKAWKQVQSKITSDGKSGRVISMNSPKWRVAASIAILFAMGAVLFLILQPSPVHVQLASTEQVITDTLPQGDIVHLNKNSAINYTFRPRQKTAHIDLKGEAFFDLRNPDHTTVVQTEGLMIRDIGTKFNVQAQYLDTVLVTVQEGEVQLYTQQNEGISVKAGEMGQYIRSTDEFEKTAFTPSNNLSWKTRNFHFNNATLSEVARTLNAVFDTQLIVEQSVENCRITVQFYNEQPKQMAEIIAETLGLQMITGEKSITLKGSGCAR